MTTLSAAQIKQELLGVTTTCLDRSYGVIEGRWLVREFLPFWRGWLFRFGAEYKSESWDCDKYARAFQCQMHIACFEANSPRTAAIAILIVESKTSHALNLIRTDGGWWEIEPQTSVISNLRKNLSTIHYATF